MLSWTAVQANPEVGKFNKNEQWELAVVNLTEIMDNMPKKSYFAENLFQHLGGR